jgi:hypothetical protein
MRGRSPAEYGMPTAVQRCDVEITQARNLDIKGLSVRQRRTDQAGWRPLPPSPTMAILQMMASWQT